VRFSQILIGEEEKLDYSKGDIISGLQKLNHPSRIESRSFGISSVFCRVKHRTNFFSASFCPYMQQNDWCLGRPLLFPAFKVQKKTQM